jgi:preprotein translocase subunit SecE
MARSRPSRGRGAGAGAPGGGASSEPRPRAAQPPAKAADTTRRRSPRPTGPGTGRRTPPKEKAGTVTKAVQQGRGSRFLSEVVAELRKVSWPTRPQLLQSTGVVLVVVAIVSLYLAAIDAVFRRLIDSLF